MFKTQKSRTMFAIALMALIVVFGIPVLPAFITGREDVYLSGVIFLGLAVIVLGTIAVTVSLFFVWIANAPGVEKKDDGDLGEVISSYAKKHHEAMPAGTIINILEMWPASAEVWVQHAQTQKMVRVQDLSYDRDYHRVIIRENGN